MLVTVLIYVFVHLSSSNTQKLQTSGVDRVSNGDVNCDNVTCLNVRTAEMRSKGCAPVYLSRNKCCPVEHVCPVDYKPLERNHVCKDQKSTSSSCLHQGFSYNRELNVCYSDACPESDNFFRTAKECVDKCITDSDYNMCLEELSPGPCFAYFPRYFYNKTSNKCVKFVYGGCKGNMNNFLTQEDCLNQCENFRTGVCHYGQHQLPKGYLIQVSDPCITCVCTRMSKYKQRPGPQNTMFCIRKTCPPQPPNCKKLSDVQGSCCPMYTCSGSSGGSVGHINSRSGRKNDGGTSNASLEYPNGAMETLFFTLYVIFKFLN